MEPPSQLVSELLPKCGLSARLSIKVLLWLTLGLHARQARGLLAPTSCASATNCRPSHWIEKVCVSAFESSTVLEDSQVNHR
eukprot:2968449-Amphidinium_carterae.1